MSDRFATMRLLNVNTFELEEFFYVNPPPYAILSHTWGKDTEEVSYRDVLDGRLNSAQTRPLKVDGCCRQAREDGYRHVWIDTCCIDKTNSVELQEAINSMFRWYRNAAICYAFLSDVPQGDRYQGPESAFFSSRWFQRGWTLQELLAPLNFRFYDASWQCIGTKGDLCGAIESITGIPSSFLLGITELHHASVAQRMSWAAKRATKRQEDMAYCLLGIFGVSIPMIYGEGDKAFRRLQEQIIKDIGDDSILAWDLDAGGASAENCSPSLFGSALAPHPSHFANSGRIVPTGPPAHGSFDMHGGSLRLSLHLRTRWDDRILGLLNCGSEQDPKAVVAIPLIAAPGENQYARPQGQPAFLTAPPLPGSSTTLVQIHLDAGRKPPTTDVQSLWFHIRKSIPSLHLVEVEPAACWHKERALIQAATEPDPDGVRRIWARFRDSEQESLDFIALLRVGSRGSARCNLMVASKATTLNEIKCELPILRHGISTIYSADNGIRSVGVELETLESPQSGSLQHIVKLVALPRPTSTTINVTATLQTVEVTRILGEFRQAWAGKVHEAGEAEEQMKESKARLTEIQRKLADVRAKIKELREEEDQLLKDNHLESMEHFRVATGHERVRQEEADLSQRVARTQQLLDLYNGGSTAEHGGDSSKAEEQILPSVIAKGYQSLVRQLLDKGTGVMGRCPDGRTPLHMAAGAGDEALVRELLDRGADVGATDLFGQTPLHQAAAGGFEGIARLLLDRGAAVAATSADGDTPIDFALAYGHSHVADLLLLPSITGPASSRASRGLEVLQSLEGSLHRKPTTSPTQPLHKPKKSRFFLR